jgi:hypothetical protein
LHQRGRASSPRRRVVTVGVLLAFVGLKDVAEEVGSDSIDCDLVRSRREPQRLSRIFRLIGQRRDLVAEKIGVSRDVQNLPLKSTFR